MMALHRRRRGKARLRRPAGGRPGHRRQAGPHAGRRIGRRRRALCTRALGTRLRRTRPLLPGAALARGADLAGKQLFDGDRLGVRSLTVPGAARDATVFWTVPPRLIPHRS
jgi:hypothetical protein